MQSFRVSILFASLAALPTLSLAQSGPPPAPAMKSISTPVDANAIPLYSGAAPGSENAQQVEKWAEVMGDQIARNVTRPTLTPFLPPKDKATGAAVIVAPGGGFMVLSMKNEGAEVAKWLASQGVAAFLLKYRVRETPAGDKEMQADMAKMLSQTRSATASGPPAFTRAVDDAQQALRMVRARAAEWGVDASRVGMIGFSAGAMTALQTVVRNDAQARPDFIATIYGPLAAASLPSDLPPLFAALAGDDPLFDSADFALISAWRKAKAPVEFHYYERGGHGFGMRAQKTTSDLWPQQFLAWMSTRGLLKQ